MQADVPVGTLVHFLNNTAERWVEQLGILGTIFDLHRVMVHLKAAVRANQFGFIHACVPVGDREFQVVSENIRASSRAMPQSRSHVAIARRFPYRFHTAA